MTELSQTDFLQEEEIDLQNISFLGISQNMSVDEGRGIISQNPKLMYEGKGKSPIIIKLYHDLLEDDGFQNIYDDDEDENSGNQVVCEPICEFHWYKSKGLKKITFYEYAHNFMTGESKKLFSAETINADSQFFKQYLKQGKESALELKLNKNITIAKNKGETTLVVNFTEPKKSISTKTKKEKPKGGDVSNEIKEKLVDWLTGDYSAKDAKKAIKQSTITQKGDKITITYKNGVKDIVSIVDGKVKHIR